MGLALLVAFIRYNLIETSVDDALPPYVIIVCVIKLLAPSQMPKCSNLMPQQNYPSHCAYIDPY